MASDRKRILIADADPDFLIALEKLVEDAGYDSRTAWNNDQVVALLGQNRFDLILVSDHSSELHCQQVAKFAGDCLPPVPCVGLISAGGKAFAEKYLLSLGMVAVVRKWRFDEVLRCIEEVFQRLEISSKRAIAG